MKTLPELRLTVKNAPLEIIKLLHVVRPTWNEDQIELKKLSGGFSCLMYTCFNKEDPDEGVTVRARTNVFEGFPHVRESAFEVKVTHTMNLNGLFPEILATFQNGYCYTYIKGSPLYLYKNPEFYLDDATIRLMARKLAELHSIKVEGCDYTKTNYFRNMYTILEESYPVSEKLPQGCVTKEDLTRELKLVEERAVQMDSPLVLCHGDPHPGNIVLNKDKDLVTYVDWELAHVGYQAGDVAYALQVFQLIVFNPLLKVQLPEDLDRKYFRFYLEKWFDIQGMKESDVADEDVDKLELQASVFRLSAQLFWVIIMVAQFTVALPDHIDMDYFETAKEAMVKALAQSTPDASAAPAVSVDANAAAEDAHLMMVKHIYASYLSMKDEVLAKCSKK